MISNCAHYATEWAFYEPKQVSKWLTIVTADPERAGGCRPFARRSACVSKEKSPSSSAPGRGPAKAWATAARPHPLRAGRRAGARGRSRLSPRPRRPRRWRQGGRRMRAFEADVTARTRSPAVDRRTPSRRWGRIDILHNNVGVSIAGGDAPPLEITEEAFDRIVRHQPARHGHGLQARAADDARAARRASIINISSVAALRELPLVAYKATKAAMIAYTQQLAIQNAAYGIRANVILPGLMDTPMAVDTRARATPARPRRGGGRARCPGAAAPQHGHRLGRRQRRAVPRLGRGQFHHRRRPAGRRRRAGARSAEERAFPVHFACG